ncbi:hypothetical protein KP509_25G033500 [Ceratopteris richardii]|uniref:Uncharacterized protein n=1 Tax=Ceratopteris richardii TaxID=49495 RepID=A0A8T2RR46_CERRI|nr:hypothetical protein KP509_25G033500 [Ceratopteris richardii]
MIRTEMVITTVGRALLEEGADRERRGPCLGASVHAVMARGSNATAEACHHSYIYARHRQGSPIPYLLAGLAAMLALIAVSLFILACSYWKLVGCVDQQLPSITARHTSSANGPSSRASQSPSTDPRGEVTFLPTSPSKDTVNRLVVIMAGHDTPTFIAQPVDGIVLETADIVTASKSSS